MLDKGVGVDFKGNGGETPLRYACEQGDVSMVRMLLANGADVDAIWHGRSVLQDALASGRCDVARLLIENGASPVTEDSDGHTPVETILHWRFAELLPVIHERVKVADIYLACALGNSERVAALLSAEPGPANVCNSYGDTPLEEHESGSGGGVGGSGERQSTLFCEEEGGTVRDGGRVVAENCGLAVLEFCVDLPGGAARGVQA